MKVKQEAINVYWRKQNNKHYALNRPDLQVRRATKEYISKKEKMSVEEEGIGLESLLDNIRSILTKENKVAIKAKRIAGVK